MCPSNTFPRQSDNGLLHSFSPTAISGVPGNSFKEDVQSTTKGWLIPHWVLRHPKLTAQEKQVMGVIVALHENKGCRCSNRYLAEQVGSTPNAIRQCLINLRDKAAIEENQMEFGKPFTGNRLIPIYPTPVVIQTGGVVNQTGGGSNSDTDSIYISIDKRERPEPCLKLSEPWKTQIVKAVLTRSPTFTEQRCRENLEALIVEKTLSGEVSEIRDWVEYLANRLLLEDRRIGLAVKKNTYSAPPARHESQFGTCH